MTDNSKELYKRWSDIMYLEKNGTIEMISISNKIKRTSNDGPFVDMDIAALIYEITKHYKLSIEDMKEYITTAIFHIRKGSSEEILRILQVKREQH